MSDDKTQKKRKPEKREMPLSCQRCRLRKVKCSFAHPCSSCVKLGVECIRIPEDMRKKRPTATYVLTLEKRLEQLSNFFHNMDKAQSAEDRERYWARNHMEMDQIISESMYGEYDTAAPDEYDQKQHEAAHEEAKLRPVYGPTSVYSNDTVHTPQTLSHKKEQQMVTINRLNKDKDILHCLRLFFTWQYPDHNMYVFREAFLGEFLHPKPNDIYCSPVLVLSICALGARMSDIDTIYKRSTAFYNEARSLLLSSLEHPSITSVQSFLLLAFYDICNGNNSTGWMLSGNAMRMGFDLGFQRNPEEWFLKNNGVLKELDVAIRSRIYWGCFMADHFISLVLGRPSILKLSDASIPETQDLPELEWIDQYKYVPDNVTNISDPLKNIINLLDISDNMLNDVFTKFDHESHSLDSSTEDLNLMSRLSKLFEYNAKIMHWKQNLPPDLNWDQESLKNTSDNPTISVVRYFYYILMLCLNRPFLGIARNLKDSQNNNLSPMVICTNTIEDLYIAIQRFEHVHGLRRASIFIVYCSILSISVILLTTTSELLGEEKKIRLRYFLHVLAGCSKTWALADKSYKLIEGKLQLQFVNDPEFQPKKPAAKRKKPAKPVKTEEIDSVALRPSLSKSSSNSQKSDTSNENGLDLSNLGIVGAENLDFPLLDDVNVEFFGPPVLMTSDLFNEDWESLFPDSIFSLKVAH